MKHRLWKTLISLLLCASVLLCAAGSLADQIPDRVTAGARGCKLRSSPEAGNDKNLIIKVHSGSTMEVLSVVGGWYLVRYLEYVGYVAANYVEITAFRESNSYSDAYLPPKNTGYLGITRFRSGETNALYDGNFSYAFSIRPVSIMKGEYWIFGGHAVEREGTVGPNGGNLRTNMDRTDKNTIIRLLHNGDKLNVKCWFFDYDGNPWYYVIYTDPQTEEEIEGYINAVNVNAGFVDFGQSDADQKKQ